MNSSPRRRLPAHLCAMVVLLGLAACGGDGDGKKKDGEPAGKDPATRAKMMETVPVRNIIVAWTGSPQRIRKDRTKDAAKTRAEELSAKLRADPSAFEAAARDSSDDVLTAPDGGFYGFISKESGVEPQVLAAAEALEEGKVSLPIDSQAGWQVLQRLSRADGRRVEEGVSKIVKGLIISWAGLSQKVPASQTKEIAYAAAAKVVHEVRSGRTILMKEAGTVPFSQDFFTVFRTPPIPGFEALGEVAHSLKVGELSDPVETKGGWAVVEREPYMRCYLRHIIVGHQTSLVPNPPQRTGDEARAFAEEAVRIVRENRSRWEEAVARFSDEPASKAQGGFMGDVTNAGLSQRRVPPEMEEALLKLKPDEISDVVESRLGYHVLWRVD
jgi:hypothetical protein